jgi:site-specific DNA recombinase
VTGERIRDKIAASKKKGMWMGGLPSLGYDVQNRKLIVNEQEALTVRHIFRRYVQLRSVRALQAELDSAGIRSKRRTLAGGTEYGGRKLYRGALYLMLQNRIYRGEITHNGNAYPGEHPVIVEKALWDEVQAVLTENRVDRKTGSAANHPSLLAGMAFDENGERLTPMHTVKKGTRYRYYVSTSLIIGAVKSGANGRRIPAANLENLVITKLRTFLADKGAILDAIKKTHSDGVGQTRLIGRGREIADELGRLAPDQIRGTLMALLSRVDIKPDRVEINILRSRLVALLAARAIDLTTQEGQRQRPQRHFDVDGDGATAARWPRNENACREHRRSDDSRSRPAKDRRSGPSRSGTSDTACWAL